MYSYVTMRRTRDLSSNIGTVAVRFSLVCDRIKEQCVAVNRAVVPNG